MRSILVPSVLVPLLLCAAGASSASSLDLGTNQTGISFGDSPRWTGIRINAVDESMERVTGLNLTLWQASDLVGGRIDGIGIGMWGPRADQLRGFHFGLAGPHANRDFRGIGIGVLGVASGDDHDGRNDRVGSMSGLMIGGAGLGAGGDIQGVAFGGLGMGAGGSIRGIAMGGLGMGVGEGLTGIAIGGLGMGVGENARGLLVGGLGAAAGENLHGVLVAGLGAGVGEDARGLLVSGLGHGIGGDFRGISVSGFGNGIGGNAEGIAIAGLGMGVGGELRGVAIAGAGMGISQTRGITLALGATRGQVMRGITASAYNRWEDEMHGLAIGIVNITRELRGVQLGVLNIAWDNPRWRRVLPGLNWGG